MRDESPDDQLTLTATRAQWDAVSTAATMPFERGEIRELDEGLKIIMDAVCPPAPPRPADIHLRTSSFAIRVDDDDDVDFVRVDH